MTNSSTRSIPQDLPPFPGAQELAATLLRRQNDLAWTMVDAVTTELKDSSLPLEAAIQVGWWAMTQRLLPLCQPKANTSRALHLAAQQGLAWVDLLLPHTDPRAGGSQALAHAALAGQAQVVARLLPLSDPAQNQYRALRHALTQNHGACIDLLVPACDLIEVMAALTQNQGLWRDDAVFRQRQALQMDRLAIRAPADLQDTWLTTYGAEYLPETADRQRARRREAHLGQQAPAGRSPSSRPRI